jgi:hypothetical protein
MMPHLHRWRQSVSPEIEVCRVCGVSRKTYVAKVVSGLRWATRQINRRIGR